MRLILVMIAISFSGCCCLPSHVHPAIAKRRIGSTGIESILISQQMTNFVEIVTPDGVLRINPPR
jgi:hypothetical protein